MCELSAYDIGKASNNESEKLVSIQDAYEMVNVYVEMPIDPPININTPDDDDKTDWDEYFSDLYS